MLDRRNVKNIYALTPMQEGMLFHSLYDEGSTAYFEQVRILLRGEVDVNVFKRSWNELVKRHDVLRTVFVYKNVPEPLQIVLKEYEIEFCYEDIRARGREGRKAHCLQYMQKDKLKAFDLSKEVPMRIMLFRMDDAEFELVWSFHHILLDGWSQAVIHEELHRIYETLSREARPDLSPAAPFGSYVKWLGRQDKAEAESYWTEYLSGYRRTASVPRSVSKNSDAFEAETFRFELTGDEMSAVGALAKKNNVTVNTVVQAVWSALLSMYNGCDDVVFAATVSGRPAEIEGIESMVGIFINAIPVRAKMPPGKSFKGLLQDLHSEASNGRDFHYYSLADIQAKTTLRQNLLDHILVFENYPFEGGAEEADGKRGRDFTIETLEYLDHTNYDLTVQVIPGGVLTFNLIYNGSAYDRAVMENIKKHLKAVIRAVSRDDGIEVRGLDVLSEGERKIYRRPVAGAGHENETTSVVIAATFTAEPVGPFIEWWAGGFGIDVDVLFAPYNQVFQQLLDPGSLLSTNGGINFLFIRFEDWLRDVRHQSERECVEHLERNFETLVSVLEGGTAGSKTFVGVFPVSPHVPFPERIRPFIEELKGRWADAISGMKNVHLVDFAEPARLYGIKELFDPQKDLAGHLPFTDEYFAAVGTWAARKLIAWKTPPFKVMVLDCDNTLWKGICGEDGPDGVEVGGGYEDLQRFLIEKNNEGILLALCSKNNEKDVWAVFDHNPQMALKRERIAASRINWAPKPDNIREIAEELNLGADSIVFIDDSGVECAEVMSRCLEVLTFKLPGNPALFPVSCPTSGLSTGWVRRMKTGIAPGCTWRKRIGRLLRLRSFRSAISCAILI